MEKNTGSSSPSRRDFIRLAAAGAGIVALPPWLYGCAESQPDASDPRAVAEAVAAWLRSHRIEERGGYTWPLEPTEGAAAVLDPASGTPGVIRFLLELYHATGDATLLEDVSLGAFLLQGAYTEGGSWAVAAGSSMADPAIDHPGLRSGWGGTAFVLNEVFRMTDNTLTQTGAMLLFDAMVGSAQMGEGTRAWYLVGPEEAYYDLDRGSAGIGLALLYADEMTGFPPALEAAADAGRYLLERAREADDGLEWPIQEGAEAGPVPLPGATAHVTLFLARLAEATDDEAFLEGARAGGRRLRGVLTDLGEPTDLIDALRAFHALARVDAAGGWQEDLDGGAERLFGAEMQDRWRSRSDRCCGMAGVGQAVLTMGLTPGGRASLEVARSIAADLVARAQPGAEGGLYWSDSGPARTGFADGVAGIGSFFVHLDAAERSRPLGIAAPDEPR
ncbi:hypothetical protein [Gaopeijia maritima]|uniref:Twin-arginine translocation signal domain-containing protein n=1 Tax=Gaopeijia maritima TaxID=3119007 RepID=A0ABU9E8I9_9BACT